MQICNDIFDEIFFECHMGSIDEGKKPIQMQICSDIFDWLCFHEGNKLFECNFELKLWKNMF